MKSKKGAKPKPGRPRKRDLHLVIRPETYQLIVKLASSIYGGRKGAVSELVEDAVRFFYSHFVLPRGSGGRWGGASPPPSVPEDKMYVYYTGYGMPPYGPHNPQALDLGDGGEEDSLDAHRKNPTHLVRDVYRSLIKLIMIETDFKPPTFIGYGRLLDWVMRSRNIGVKQAKRWIFRLYQQGLLKPIKPKKIKLENESSVSKVILWELVYEGGF